MKFVSEFQDFFLFIMKSIVTQLNAKQTYTNTLVEPLTEVIYHAFAFKISHFLT